MASSSSRVVRAEAEKAARQTLAARASLIGDLAATAHEVQQIECQLAEARERHANAHQAAIDGGWTATELESLKYAPDPPPTARSSPRRNAARLVTPVADGPDEMDATAEALKA